MQEYIYEAKFNFGEDAVDICQRLDSLYEMFDAILNEAKANKRPGDRMRVHVNHSSLDIPVTMHLTDYREVTAEELLNRFVE